MAVWRSVRWVLHSPLILPEGSLRGWAVVKLVEELPSSSRKLWGVATETFGRAAGIESLYCLWFVPY